MTRAVVALTVVAVVAGGLWWVARVLADAPCDCHPCDLCGDPICTRKVMP